MADQDLVMKAINMLAEAIGKQVVVNPPTGEKQDWKFDSDAVAKDQKGDCLVSLNDKP